MTRRPAALWVLALSGLLGFRVGVVGFPNWQVPVETAQVVARLVQYPADNPFYIYHTKLWTLLHQVCAVLLRLGVSEIALSLFLSGVIAMASFQALSLFVFALSGRVWFSVGAAIVVFYSRAAEYGVTYPITLAGTSHTYGALGLSMFVLVVALFGCGWYRLGGFLLGLTPAIHPSLGVWLWITLAFGILWDVRRLREDLRPALPYVVAGVALTAASLIVQLVVTYDVPPVDPAVSARYFNTFVEYFDGHRQVARIVSAGVAFNCAACVLSLVWLVGFSRDMPRSLVLLLGTVFSCALLSLVFVLLSRVPPTQLPEILVMLMPTRLLNFNTMCLVPLLFGLLAWRRIGVWSDMLMAVLVAGLLLTRRSMFWEWIEGRGPAFHSPLDQGLVIAAVSAGLLLLAMAALSRRSKPEVVTPDRPEETSATSIAARAARLVLVLVFAAGVVLTWRIRSNFSLLDRTNDPFWAEAAADRTGLIATAGSFHLVQLRTRRPVLLDGASLDTLPYAPESGPAMERILRDVYHIDFFDPAPRIPYGVSGIPPEAHRDVWEGFSLEAWQKLGRAYNVTQVLTDVGWVLKLPLAARNGSFNLYRIPDSSGPGPP